MLRRLRLDPLIGSHHQKRGINSRRPGDHGFDKLFVAWDIDQVYVAAGQDEMREAQNNGHPPFLLLFEPIGLGSRQGPNKRRLAVVNMSGNPHREMLHVIAFLIACTISASSSSRTVRTSSAKQPSASTPMTGG